MDVRQRRLWTRGGSSDHQHTSGKPEMDERRRPCHCRRRQEAARSWPAPWRTSALPPGACCLPGHAQTATTCCQRPPPLSIVVIVTVSP